MILTNKGASVSVGEKDHTGLYSSNATLIVVPLSVLNQAPTINKQSSSLYMSNLTMYIVGRRDKEAHYVQYS